MNSLEAGQKIVDWEARRDSNGHLRVYLLPPSDGGGTFEIAGINERYDHDMAHKLKELIESGRHEDAEKEAAAYIGNQTDAVKDWSTVPAVEFFLRDTMFNRGKGGAAKILQEAVGADIDGGVGPLTRAAVKTAERRPLLLLYHLRAAREHYEQKNVGYRPEFATGLQNRWDNAFEASAQLLINEGHSLIA